jgi:hypothetical protein
MVNLALGVIPMGHLNPYYESYEDVTVFGDRIFSVIQQKALLLRIL